LQIGKNKKRIKESLRKARVTINEKVGEIIHVVMMGLEGVVCGGMGIGVGEKSRKRMMTKVVNR